jgi:hypothetical protein
MTDTNIGGHDRASSAYISHTLDGTSFELISGEARQQSRETLPPQMIAGVYAAFVCSNPALEWTSSRETQAKLGPIPDECGLQRVIGHVRVADYADLFTEVQLRKLVPGYQMALHALINSVLRWIPKHEQVRSYFGRFVARRNNYESIPSGMLVHPRGCNFFDFSRCCRSKQNAFRALPQSRHPERSASQTIA